jgi:glycosyltransferase involved in cell wall biosynthesis
MNEKPLISVIIPVYNITDRLSIMLDSLERQDYQNLEIVVYDDCSEDSCEGEIIKSLLMVRRFARTQFLRGNKNFGVAFARNRGLEAAQGEYIAFVDGDDYVEDNYISSLYRALCREQSDYSSCGYARYDESKKQFLYHPLNVSTSSQDSVLCARIHNTCEISHIASLFKKDFLFKSGVFFTEGCTAGEDMEFILKFMCHGRGAFIPECLYIYVQHEAMGSRKNVLDKEKKFTRYRDHAYAQIRQACYVIHHAGAEPCKLARDMLFPNACQCVLSLFPMCNDRVRYDKLLASPRLRKNLWAAWRSFLYKPEIFIRSCCALLFPGLYWKKYSQYL